MAYDDLDFYLTEEALRMEQFSEEIRERMRALMQDIERDFQQFIDRMLGEQASRLEAEAASISTQGESPAFGALIGGGFADALGNSFSSGSSLLGSALGTAFNAALASYTRSGTLTPRSIANAGGRAIATQISASSLRTQPDSPRLSRAQFGEGLLQELTRAQRNS